MDSNARKIIADKFGMLHVANVELAIANDKLVSICTQQSEEIEKLKAELAASKKLAVAKDRPESGDDLPANPYSNGSGPH